jgi:hypothetical protein
MHNNDALSEYQNKVMDSDLDFVADLGFVADAEKIV